MDAFGRNFLKVRNENIIPLVSYGIKKDKFTHWRFKDILTKRITAFSKTSKDTFQIELAQSDFYNALHCDIELFMNKSLVQFNDSILSKSNSATWSYVTLYYFAFFSCVTLFRFLKKGFIFLSAEHTKAIEEFAYAVNSDIIKLNNGNYYFSYTGENAAGDAIITLTHKGDTVHKSTWIQFESTMREFIKSSDNDEKVIFSNILSLFKSFKIEYPSTLRNQLNYVGESSFFDLERMLDHVELKTNLNDVIKGLLSTSSDNTIPNQIKSITYLSVFLFRYNNELYREFLTRSKFGSDFNKLRLDFSVLKGIKI